METEMIGARIDTPPKREEEALSPQKQRARERRHLRKKEGEERKARKERLRLLRRTPCHRCQLRAAGALLMAGSLGITALCATLGCSFGWRSHLERICGEWAGDAIIAAFGLLLTLALLYPLWLGMRAYATLLYEETAEKDPGLFGFYTDPRLRRFAAACVFRSLAKIAVLVLAMAAVLLPGGWLSAHFLAAENSGRAAVCALVTALFSLLLPFLWGWMGQGEAMSLRFYLSDETLTVKEARRASRLAMRHRGGARMLLIAKKLPLAAVGLLFFGIGLALFSIPDLVWSLALFESQPT